METYTIKRGVMRRIPEWPELRWFAERLISFLFGLCLGLAWQIGG